MDAAEADPNRVSGTRLRALVVEDDADIRKILADVLVERGHHVVACPDGETAWTACQQATFALVLLDLGLPGMDGLELCRRLRALPHGDQSVVVVLTARLGADPLEAVLAAGADDYLAKPFDLRYLERRLSIAERQATALQLRAAAEEALRTSEARFRSLIHNAADLILILAPDDTLSYVSPAIEQVLGYAPEDLLGADPFILVHPDDVARVRGDLAHLAATPQRQVATAFRSLHRDGSWRWLEAIETNLIADTGVGGIVVNARDITERRALEAQLARSALTDSLTGLPNRALFLERLGQALARREQDGTEVGVLFLDLDRFKVVNDSLGHGAGDRALVAVGERLLTCVRPGDTVARFGGDEFMVLLAGCAVTEAIEVAGLILAALRVPLRVNGHDAVVDASVGIAVSAPTLHVPADLLRAADTALYRAKATGRGVAVVFEAGMYADAVMRLDRETDLRAAVQRGHLHLQFQPEVDLATGRVVALEALARWDRPGHGEVAPADFIPVAEETGLILPLGAWVLTEACRQARAWSVARGSHLAPAVSVNVSATQVRQPDFVAQVERVLEETGLEADHLTLEVTEQVFVEDAATTNEALREVKALGVGLAIDDFGIGYSSLGYLRRLPVDTLKIDRSFVSGVGREADDRAIVTAITALGHALGMTVTAEGVETAEQLEHARRVGCDHAQGFYLGQPQDPATLGTLLGDPRLTDAAAG